MIISGQLLELLVTYPKGPNRTIKDHFVKHASVPLRSNQIHRISQKKAGTFGWFTLS
jgi:hypothetical protein